MTTGAGKMNRRGLAGLTVFVMMAAPVAAQDAAAHRFEIDGNAFEVPVPAGYCLPEGAALVLAEEIARLDRMNFTHANFDRCGTFGDDYVHIKTPRVSEPVNMPKSLFLPLLAREMEGAAGPQMMTDAIEEAGRTIAEDTGNAVLLGQTVPRFGGYDTDCVYVFLDANVVVGESVAVMRSATCMTLVGRQFIAVNAYAAEQTGTTDAQLKARSRAVAASIRIIAEQAAQD